MVSSKNMSQKKLLIGLPVALLLGGSAIAFGVLPGVRDWVDQTIPWLGINGPKDATAFGKLVHTQRPDLGLFSRNAVMAVA